MKESPDTADADTTAKTTTTTITACKGGLGASVVDVEITSASLEPNFRTTASVDREEDTLRAATSSSTNSTRSSDLRASNINGENRAALRILSKDLDEQDHLAKIKAQSINRVYSNNCHGGGGSPPPVDVWATEGSTTARAGGFVDSSAAPTSGSTCSSTTCTCTTTSTVSASSIITPSSSIQTQDGNHQNEADMERNCNEQQAELLAHDIVVVHAHAVFLDEHEHEHDDNAHAVQDAAEPPQAPTTASGRTRPNDDNNHAPNHELLNAAVTLIALPDAERMETGTINEPKVVEAHHVRLTDFLENRTLQVVLGGILCLVVALAVVVSVGVVLSSDSSHGENILSLAPSSMPTNSYTLSPAPTEAFTPQPTMLVMEPTTAPLLVDLPDYTVAEFQDRLSPQSLAYRWLEDHPNLEQMPTWRRQQIIALLSIYYSLDGEGSWTEEQKRNYLSYTIPECQWGPSASSSSSAAAASADGITCTDDGRIQQINLQSINGDTIMSHRQGTLPPEVALLTSLQSLQINNCEFDKFDLKAFLPTQLGSLPELKKLEFYHNKLYGTIPLTPIPELAQLEYLSLDSNVLEGPLPSEIGRLASLKYFSVAWNSFSGAIPTDIGLLQQLTTLRLYTNSFNGRLPSEISLLTRLESLLIQNNDRLRGSLAANLCDEIPSLRIVRVTCPVMSCPTSCWRICQCGL